MPVFRERKRAAAKAACKRFAPQNLGAGGLRLAAHGFMGPHKIRDFMGQTGGIM